MSGAVKAARHLRPSLTWSSSAAPWSDIRCGQLRYSMVKYYYTVIVGTQPGVYDDWAQAAPTVIGISGAIHRKYNTEREAWEAFDIAVCEGRVRTITTDPATPRRRVRRSSQQDRTANSTTNDVSWPTHRDPENASRNTSSPVSANNFDPVTSIGVGPLRRTTSEYHGNSGQPLRTMSNSGTSSLLSPSSPVGPSRVYEHADFPRRGFSTRWPGENRWNNEQGTVGSPGASNTATQHGEGVVGTSTEIGQRTRESPSPSLLLSLQTGHLIHEVPGGSHVKNISETARYRQNLDHFLAPGAQATTGSDHSPIPSTLGDQLVDHDEGQGSRSRVWDFVLGRPRNQGDDYDRGRASLQSVGTFLDSPGSTQRVQNSHTQFQNRTESPFSLGAPNLSPLSSSSPRGVWPASSSSHFSFDVSPSTASGLGLLTGVASSHRHSLPPSPAAQNFPESLVDRSVRSIDAQSSTRDTESSRDAPQQDQASSPHLTAATSEDTQRVRTRPIDYGSLSHHNVPLSPSPVPSRAASDSSYPRLQVQPAHRHTPRMPMYPSLPGQDPELLSLSGLDIGFGLPTPRLSPTQAQAVVRPPSMDPRSPVPTQMRIPGDIMEPVFFGRPTPPPSTTRTLP
ncbi:hypothetical protein EDB87DRAFT_1647310 [Lactarius vividus]|nr:hypothetical protein EDB87DRAFT_1647310 [Lactarius vividus]